MKFSHFVFLCFLSWSLFLYYIWRVNLLFLHAKFPRYHVAVENKVQETLRDPRADSSWSARCRFEWEVQHRQVELDWGIRSIRNTFPCFVKYEIEKLLINFREISIQFTIERIAENAGISRFEIKFARRYFLYLSLRHFKIFKKKSRSRLATYVVW